MTPSDITLPTDYRDSQYRISLRIFHDTADCGALAAELDIPLRPARRKGVLRATLTGPDSASERSLSEALADQVERLKPHASTLRAIIADGGRTELFVGWWLPRNSMDHFGPELLGSLAALGLGLEFDVYPARLGEDGT